MANRTRQPDAGAHARRGSVVVIVIWTIAIATMTVAATQLLSFRQASIGRLAVERTQSRWAARAGIEQTIAVMATHTEHPIPDDRIAMQVDLEAVADGSVFNATWAIRHR
ncbi:MAG: hypothetical protein ACYTGC_15405, partial [Planctomycetota bacterium]